MPIYYVGAGGSDLALGTSWATRLATLTGAEDAHGGGTPKPAIAPGDSVYVAPGVYRELLTCDVSGLAGQPITYVADTTGEHTDGVGGVVRISGSNNDQVAVRANCITAEGINYRTFRGFMLDGCSQNNISTGVVTGCTNWIVEDCNIYDCYVSGILVRGVAQSSWIIRRCLLCGIGSSGLLCFFGTASNTNHLVQNCQFISGVAFAGIRIIAVGGIAIRNDLFIGGLVGIHVSNALPVGQTDTVNNCNIYGCFTGLQATVVGEITENYNNLYNFTARTNVAVGANSTAYPPVFQPPVLNSGAAQVSGFLLPWVFGSLSSWSKIRAISGASEATEDLFGIARPATAALNSWGPVQFQQITQDMATVRTGTLSQEFTTAGRRQLIIPVQAVNTTITVYVYREANYAGVNPQMILKQSGQADITITDAGGLSAWNQLTHTWIPSAVPSWLVIELVSNNTAAAGSFAVYFDDLTVSPLDTDTQEAWLTAEQPVNYAEEATVTSAAFSPVGSDIVKG